jgi:hypothetical protein
LASGVQARRYWRLYGTAEQLAEKVRIANKERPSAAKAQDIYGICGSAEAEPFQNRWFFRKL